MAELCGKGIWLSHSYDLQRAAEMAAVVDSTHLLIKIGHGPIYYNEIARTMLPRVRALGFHPLAWLELTETALAEASKAIVEALRLGYEGLALYSAKATIPGAQGKALARALANVEIPRQRLFLATPPFPHISDRSFIEVLAPACQGGWMPLCFGEWGEQAQLVIDRDVYHALGDLSLVWGKTPDIYPVVSPRYSFHGGTFLAEEFIPWVEGITRHGIDFYSVFHAADTEKALWPVIQSAKPDCIIRAEKLASQTRIAEPETTKVVQSIYITAEANDTVGGIIRRYGLTKEQFWAWNGQLWDSRGLPRDPDYMQQGWRLRVK